MGGASGAIGAIGAIDARRIAKSVLDGYTLLVGSDNEITINKLINRNTKYYLSDFKAIGVIAFQPLVLVASPQCR